MTVTLSVYYDVDVYLNRSVPSKDDAYQVLQKGKHFLISMINVVCQIYKRVF